MPRKPRLSAHDDSEMEIKSAGTIGALERLAGIGNSPDERTAFWLPFSKIPGVEALDAGSADLKRRIRAQAAATPRRRERAEGVHHG